MGNHQGLVESDDSESFPGSLTDSESFFGGWSFGSRGSSEILGFNALVVKGFEVKV